MCPLEQVKGLVMHILSVHFESLSVESITGYLIQVLEIYFWHKHAKTSHEIPKLLPSQHHSSYNHRPSHSNPRSNTPRPPKPSPTSRNTPEAVQHTPTISSIGQLSSDTVSHQRAGLGSLYRADGDESSQSLSQHTQQILHVIFEIGSSSRLEPRETLLKRGGCRGCLARG
jgi:hypothetical protein